jgi:hypothetical protein
MKCLLAFAYRVISHALLRHVNRLTLRAPPPGHWTLRGPARAR